MEHVRKQDAQRHQHTPDCAVYEYATKNSDISVAVAELQGRYPDEGYVVNHKCTEMGYVLKGRGKLITDTQIVDLAEGDVVLIPQGEKFYWEGTLKLLLPTAPAWSPDQHEHLASPDKFQRLKLN